MQAAFTYRDRATGPVSLDGVTERWEYLSAWLPDRDVSHYELELFVTVDPGGGLVGRLVYSTDLFDRVTAERMAGHYRSLLEQVAARPSARLSELALLGEDERRVVLGEWNDTAAVVPGGTLAGLVQERAAACPEAVAVVSGERALTYRELDAAASRLAWRLRELGVGPEVVVGVCLPRGPDLVVALLAVLRAGGAYLPLDPDYPPARLAFMTADGGAALVVTAGGCPDAGTGARVLRVDDPEEARRVLSFPVVPPPGAVLAGQLAYVIYTSGSTGRPKGVMVTHDALLNYLAWAQRAYCGGKPASAVLHSSVAVDFSLTLLWLPLLTGGCVACGEALATGEWQEPPLRGDRSPFADVTPGQLMLASEVRQAPTTAKTVVVGSEQLTAEMLRAAAPSARRCGGCERVRAYGDHDRERGVYRSAGAGWGGGAGSDWGSDCEYAGLRA